MDAQIMVRLQRALEEHRLPGLAVVIRHRDKDLFAGGVGHFDAIGRRPVGELTPFGVASLSKFVTTMMVLLLEERGVLSIDDLLARYYPSLEIAQQVPIRLTHLLSHSAGLPGLPGRFYARNIGDIHDRSGGVGQRGGDLSENKFAGLPDMPTILNAAELVELINQLNVDLLAPPDGILNYSNEGFCLVGGVIEKIMQRSFADLAQEMIFAPLQMDQSSVGGVNASVPVDAVAWPLVRDGNGYRAAGFWQAPLFYPAGGCVSSARDIARLIGSLANDAPLLSQNSKQKMMQSRMPVASRPNGGIGYGLGLECQRLDASTTMLWHSGQRAGVSSFMGYLVEQQISVSMLCNVADAPVTAIAHDLIGETLQRSDIRWPPTVLTQSVESFVADNAERFVGRYESPEGGSYGVEWFDGGLVLTTAAAGQTQALHFTGSDYGTVGAQTFRFLSAPSRSKAWAFAVDLRVLRRAG